ncbi:hypothetical protein BJ742DRAFT_816728 [Cladochytrium replicatum]|nr:hypothetical protein BJ742DRAFT_816728 [Cladochytrium replicatum]
MPKEQKRRKFVGEQVPRHVSERKFAVQNNATESMEVFAGMNAIDHDTTHMEPSSKDLQTERTLVTKKERKQERRERWGELLSTGARLPASAKKNKKRALKKKEAMANLNFEPLKSVIADMESTADTTALDGAPTSTQTLKKSKSVKARRKESVADMALFQRVAQHPVFQRNPLLAIQKHAAAVRSATSS